MSDAGRECVTIRHQAEADRATLTHDGTLVSPHKTDLVVVRCLRECVSPSDTKQKLSWPTVCLTPDGTLVSLHKTDLVVVRCWESVSQPDNKQKLTGLVAEHKADLVVV